MADNHREIQPLREPDEPTIRFTIDPALLRQAAQRGKDDLVDTYVGAPLLPPEQPEAPAPRRKKRWKLVCTCAALALALCAAGFFLLRGESAAQTAETFLSAMDSADSALLRSVAEGRGVTLESDNLAPLFALYQMDEAFRAALREALRAQAENGERTDGMFHLENRSHGLRRAYTVVIVPGAAAVESNLPDAQITVGKNAAVWDAAAGYAVTAPLLPGSYAVTGMYVAPYGDEFRAETVLRLSEPESRCALRFDFASIAVYNSARAPVQISVGGSEYATLEPEQELTISPLAPQTEVVAVGPASETLTATAEDGFLYVHFDLCQVEVYNDYAVPIALARGDLPPVEIPAGEKLTLPHVPAGDVLTASADPHFGLMPYIYRVEYDYEYLNPVFRLNDAQENTLRPAAEVHVRAAFEAYTLGEAALLLLPQSVVVQALSAQLALPEPPQLLPGSITFLAYDEVQPHADGSITLCVELAVQPVLELPETGAEPTEPTAALARDAWRLRMTLRDGAWQVAPAPQEVAE